MNNALLGTGGRLVERVIYKVVPWLLSLDHYTQSFGDRE